MKRILLFISILHLVCFSLKAQVSDEEFIPEHKKISEYYWINSNSTNYRKLLKTENTGSDFVLAGNVNLSSQFSIKENALNLNHSARLNPGVSVILSWLMAGGGQYYNRQYTKGAIMTATELGGIVLIISSIDRKTDSIKDPRMFLGGLGCAIVAAVWSIIDAPISAIKINKRNGYVMQYRINKNLHLSLEPTYSFESTHGLNYQNYGIRLSVFMD